MTRYGAAPAAGVFALLALPFMLWWGATDPEIPRWHAITATFVLGVTVGLGVGLVICEIAVARQRRRSQAAWAAYIDEKVPPL